jgi:hypothetical protein
MAIPVCAACPGAAEERTDRSVGATQPGPFAELASNIWLPHPDRNHRDAEIAPPTPSPLFLL